MITTPTKTSVLTCILVLLTASAFASVTVSNPANGSTVGSPVSYAATATTTTCSRGVASMGVYVENQLKYVSNGTTLNTSLSLSPGAYHTVVEEWDYCGGATYTPILITVGDGQSGVWVTSPTNKSIVGPSVNYSATGATSCSAGLATMGVYVDNQLMYVSNGSTLNTTLSISPGSHNTVVEEWDRCGGASYTPVQITVEGGGAGGGNPTLHNLQTSDNWTAYGEYPPNYNICSSCGGGVNWWIGRGVKSPSLSGNATQYNVGGSHPYADVLFTNPLIGQNSSQGLPDSDHTLVPSIHNFTYDLYFYGANLGVSQVLEFDVSQYFNGLSFIWGTQCRIAGGNMWDIWDNVNSRWVSTGVACNPNSGSWNHVILQLQREPDNSLLYKSITLNNATADLNQHYARGSAPGGWWGVTVNFQMDGNYKQSPYTVLLDNFNLSYY